MNPILQFASSLIWPAIVVAFGIYFRAQFKAFLDRAASFKLKVLGGELELTVREAENTLKELLNDVTSMVNDITEQERQLYITIRSSDGRRTVKELLPTFERGNEDHKRLQSLRDRKLIRPFEGSAWQPDKHPVITRFSHLIERLYPEVLEPQQFSIKPLLRHPP